MNVSFCIEIKNNQFSVQIRHFLKTKLQGMDEYQLLNRNQEQPYFGGNS